MKRLLQTLAVSVAFLLVGGSANAQTDLSKMRVAAISDALTTQPEAGKYYLLEQNRGNTMTPAGDTGEGNTITRASSADAVSVGDMASAVENYLLQFIPTDDVSETGLGGVYILQYATGNYWVSIADLGDAKGITTTSDAEEAGIYNVYPITTGGNLFGLNAFDMGKLVDNNGVGSDVVAWSEGQNDGTSANNVWTIYEVTLEEVSDVAIELQDLIAEAQAAYDSNEDVMVALISSTEQFSSPYTYEGSLDNLLDGDANTFWHSDWSSAVENGIHYIQVDLADDFVGGDLILSILRRNNANNQVVKMSIKDGDDNLIDTVDLPYEAQGETVEAEFTCPEGIYTLRFYNEGTVGNTQSEQGFFHLAGLQLYYADPVIGYNTKHPTLAATLAEAIETAQAALEGDATLSDVAALQAAIDTYLRVIDKPIEEGEYLLVNAENGYYLGGGLTWGTQGTQLGKPQFFGLEVLADGTYTLDSHQYNSAVQHYLGTNLYVDADVAYWTVEEAGDGYTLYNATAGGYLTGNGFQAVLSAEEEATAAAVWTLVSKADVLEAQANVEIGSTVDVTPLIAAPELKRNCNTSYYPTWTVTGYDGTGTPSNYAFGSGSNVANCAESYHSTNGFNICQTLTGLKAGKYTLGACAFYRDDSSTTRLLPVMYAGDVTVEFPELDTSANSMADAYAEFIEGQHAISLDFTVENDGDDVVIGFKGEDTSLWNIFGELSLTYHADPVWVEVHECEAEFDHWSIAGNSSGAFQLNNWSVEDDPSGMVTPFIEYWIGTGSILSDATISHTALTGLEAGDYKVSIFARAFNEGSTDPVSEGIAFTANGESVDLTTGTIDVWDGKSAEVYGTYEVECTVGEDGILNIGFDVAGLTACDWVAFKNLVVYQSASEPPAVTPVEGVMNADVAAAQDAAVAAYAELATGNNYYAAVDAIAAAEISIAYYTDITAEIEAVVPTLDEDGAAAWAASATAVAYEARTLTDEDVKPALAAAVLAQTTEGSDMTYAVLNAGEWSADQGNGPAAYSTFATETYIGTGEATSGKVLYYTVEGLQPGTYTVTFYAAANMANGISGDSGSDISVAYANDVTTSMTVGTNSAAQITSLDDMTLYSVTCTVDMDGTLEFGIQNVADGGNWFLGAVNSLTFLKAPEDLSELIAQYEADLTEAAALVAELEESIAINGADEAYDADILAEMEEALAGLQEAISIYGDIDTTDTTKEALEEAIAALEAAMETASSAYATAISSLATSTEGNDVIYTISGTRVSKAVKGIYIVNGKKVLVK